VSEVKHTEGCSRLVTSDHHEALSRLLDELLLLNRDRIESCYRRCQQRSRSSEDIELMNSVVVSTAR
jgi:hypothetical protein